MGNDPTATIDLLQSGVSLEQIMPDIGSSLKVDPAIITALPYGCEYISTTAYGASHWTRTAKITTKQQNGSEKSFFLKMATGELGRIMFRGEFEAMSVIHRTTPEFAPKPIAWGECKRTEDFFFFLSEFVDMIDGGLPDPKKLCESLCELHRNAKSPRAKFGFHVTTCNGNIPQDNDWEDSWEIFFAKGLRKMLALDLQANGPQPELVEAIIPVFDVVIPRLLRPLQRGNNPIIPRLVHGDLWCGNTATNLKSDKPIVFDAAAFYGHNEYELGNWLAERNRFSKTYIEEYGKHFEISEPKEDFDDRILLYELRFSFHYSIMFPGPNPVKQLMIRNMLYLGQKYV